MRALHPHWFQARRKIPYSLGTERLLDLYTPDWARIWFHLVPEGFDLDIEDCGEDTLGVATGSIAYETDQNGFDAWVGSCEASGQTQRGRFSWRCDWAQWALINGIAPRQPFLLHLHSPYYSKSWTDCGYEYDCDCEFEVMRVVYWSPSKCASYWDRWLRGVQAGYDADMRNATHQDIQLLRDRSALKVISGMYVSHGYYDEMDMPDRYRLTLTSKHYHRFSKVVLPSVDSDSWDEAYTKLTKAAQSFYPDITAEFLRSITQHTY